MLKYTHIKIESDPTNVRAALANGVCARGFQGRDSRLDQVGIVFSSTSAASQVNCNIGVIVMCHQSLDVLLSY